MSSSNVFDGDLELERHFQWDIISTNALTKNDWLGHDKMYVVSEKRYFEKYHIEIGLYF